MSANEPQPRTSPRPLLPPGYFACKRRIKILKRYQALIRHHERWGDEIQFAPPIEQVIPTISPATDPLTRYKLIEREINRATKGVFGILNEAGIPTRISQTVWDPVLELEGQRQPREQVNDIIFDYFHLVRAGPNQRISELLMRILDQGIGAYEMRLKRGLLELFNPLYWIAMLLHAPIWILTRAGLAGDDKMLALYGTLIRLLFILALGFFAIREGVITLRQALTFLLKHMPS